jgi:peptidoglycan/xylan/chitin deacetylase (PgdA/CDA1 family)
VSATFSPELAVVLSFHGVVERIDDPEIQVNHIDIETFERILALVAKRYEVVSLDDVAAALRDGAALPEHAAALTFDDAYRSVLEVADPLLTERGFPYAVFVPSALVDAGARVPTYVMRAALSLTDERSVQLPGRRRPFKLRTRDDRNHAATHAAELLRTLTLAAAETLLAHVHALLSENAWKEADARFASEELLGWPELQMLAQREVTIGSHTRDHAVLHAGQALDDVVNQLEESKATIEERLGTACRHFCFPHGQPRDLSRDAVEAARAAGYITAFMNVGGPVREGMDPLLLPRIAIAGSPPDGALADRVQLSHSKWYRRVAAELHRD